MGKLTKYESLNNLFGELQIDIVDRIEKYLNRPCEKNWDDIYGIILNDRKMLSVWQAVIAVDSMFPTTGPVSTFCAKTRTSTRTEGWSAIPHIFTLRRALKYAQTI